MKAIFYNYQNKLHTRDEILVTEINIIPLKGDIIEFPYNYEGINYSTVTEICHCFNLKGEFTHIDIEIEDF
tara:strand:- start:984 stop:1196 length:213 start_codon:yes stop_codon:yes gene_type:complete